MQKLKKTRRKHIYIYIYKLKETENKHITTQRKTIKKRNTGFPAHEPPQKINISKGLAGRFLLFIMFMFSLEFVCFVYVVVCVCSIVNAKALKN